MFSGRVAGYVFSQINIPDNIIILAPNHTGCGPLYSVWPDGSWRTPMGDVNVD
ncbi:MAG: AmmeMemoRadiSam system protein B, partial [Candidatus Anammoxibacter sp.]